MEQERLEACVERIDGNTSEVSKTLYGLDMLHAQGVDLIKRLDDSIQDDSNLNQIDSYLSEVFTWLDLVKITLDHAQDRTRFIHEAACEIQTNGYEDLSVIQRGAA